MLVVYYLSFVYWEEMVLVICGSFGYLLLFDFDIYWLCRVMGVLMMVDVFMEMM